jgi:hypothetical protein
MPLPGSGGVAIDRNGLVWQNWRGAHQMLSFDRRKCKVLNGPNATGQQCPEGWTLYTKPGPTFQGGPDYSSTPRVVVIALERQAFRRNRRQRKSTSDRVVRDRICRFVWTRG